MKKLLPVVVILVVATSCTKSQFVSLQSDADLAPSGGYVYENDTVQVNYAFKGDNGPIIIKVYNKLSVPIYVDWTKSATVVNHKTIVFRTQGSSFTANTEATNVDWGYVSTSNGTISGIIERPNDMSFIAPHSMITDDRKTITSNFFEISPKARKSRKKVFRPNGPVMVNVYKYQREDSPYSFRVYLTIVTDPKSSEAMHVESEFWVSEIVQSGDIDKSYPLKENEFRITKATGFASGVATVALLGAVTTLVLIDKDDSCCSR